MPPDPNSTGATTTVTVPHTWNSTPATADVRGLGWYERRLDLPGHWAGKRVRLKFDAAYRDTTVWINGRKAGAHLGSGYTTFWVDATPHLTPGRPGRPALDHPV